MAPKAPVPVTTNTPEILPTLSPTPSPTLMPTSLPYQTTELTATVWESEPYTVNMTYHQFAANTAERSTGLKVRMADFEFQLNQLYDAGFSLISLEDWMAGNIVVPEGRRPLLMSIDDCYFNNQIRLDEDGVPRLDTGIGILWAFYQVHPDFGFSVALYANLGDKLYADPDDPTWQIQLAETIVWGIDHGAVPYNHFYTHPQLDHSGGDAILWEARQNDVYLRELLVMAEREDLIPSLRNILALTYGVWPKYYNIPTMLSYVNPEGVPVEAVMEIDPISLEKYLMPPWSPEYDLLRMPRHVAAPSSINFLVERSEQFPAAQECVLKGIPVDAVGDREQLAGYIGESAAQAGCPSGDYIVGGYAFRVDVVDGAAIPLDIQTELVFEN